MQSHHPEGLSTLHIADSGRHKLYLDHSYHREALRDDSSIIQDLPLAEAALYIDETLAQGRHDSALYNQYSLTSLLR